MCFINETNYFAANMP